MNNQVNEDVAAIGSEAEVDDNNDVGLPLPPEVDGLVEADAGLNADEREIIEHNALARVLEDVRAQSAQSVLVRPARWVECGMVPDHMTADEFEMFVYEYVEEEKALQAQAVAEQQESKPVYRSATRAVGVPNLFGNTAMQPQEPASEAKSVDEVALVAEEDVLSCVDEALPEEVLVEGDDDVDDFFANFQAPAGYKLVELEGEYVLVVDEEAELTKQPMDCRNMVALVGAHSYYLYDSSIMTDTYARWAFLAAEDNRVVTFVSCVREESRVYPRPLPASSLKNPPFDMNEDDIDATWTIVRESGEYPDIQQAIASNGDGYFYSTDHLSSTYADSLAEWDAVERRLCL